MFVWIIYHVYDTHDEIKILIVYHIKTKRAWVLHTSQFLFSLKKFNKGINAEYVEPKPLYQIEAPRTWLPEAIYYIPFNVLKVGNKSHYNFGINQSTINLQWPGYQIEISKETINLHNRTMLMKWNLQHVTICWIYL